MARTAFAPPANELALERQSAHGASGCPEAFRLHVLVDLGRIWPWHCMAWNHHESSDDMQSGIWNELAWNLTLTEEVLLEIVLLELGYAYSGSTPNGFLAVPDPDCFVYLFLSQHRLNGSSTTNNSVQMVARWRWSGMKCLEKTHWKTGRRGGGARKVKCTKHIPVSSWQNLATTSHRRPRRCVFQCANIAASALLLTHADVNWSLMSLRPKSFSRSRNESRKDNHLSQKNESVMWVSHPCFFVGFFPLKFIHNNNDWRTHRHSAIATFASWITSSPSYCQRCASTPPSKMNLETWGKQLSMAQWSMAWDFREKSFWKSFIIRWIDAGPRMYVCHVNREQRKLTMPRDILSNSVSMSCVSSLASSTH